MIKQELISQQILDLACGLTTNGIEELLNNLSRLQSDKIKLVKKSISEQDCQRILDIYRLLEEITTIDLVLSATIPLTIFMTNDYPDVTLQIALRNCDPYSRYYIEDILGKNSIYNHPDVIDHITKGKAIFQARENLLIELSNKYKLQKSIMAEYMKHLWDNQE